MHDSLPPFRSNRTYIITGGNGGIGAECSRRIIACGATVVILGRREKLTATPTHPHLHYLCVDVSDLKQLQAAFDVISVDGLPPVGGILHCAGTLSDRTIVHHDWDSFASVFASKVKGTWNLHNISLQQPKLEIFVLFSSVASVFGSPGQANHSAACSFMDAVAATRRALGLPVININWGAWSRIGAAEEKRASLHAGIAWISPEDGFSILYHYLSTSSDRSQSIIVANIDWKSFLQCRDQLVQAYKYNKQRRKLGDTTIPSQESPVQSYSVQSHDVDSIVQQACISIGEANSGVSRETTLSSMGIDSLRTTHLQKLLSKQLGVFLPSKLFYGDSTIESLSQAVKDIIRSTSKPNNEQPLLPAFHISKNQQALWLLQKCNLYTYSYNVPMCFFLSHDVQPTLLREAFHILLSHYDILRSSFSTGAEGGCKQTIHAIEDLDTSRFLVEQLPSDHGMEEKMIAASHRPFDLEVTPLIRATLFIAPSQAGLVLVAHHIIFDGVSASIFIQQLFYLYSGLARTGKSPEIPPCKQFNEFVTEQEALLTSPIGQDLHRFWGDELSGAPVLDLPVDFPRPPFPTMKGGTILFEIPPAQYNLLKQSLPSGISTFVYLLAVYFVLLFRITNQEDIIVGTPVEGRNFPGYENTIGYFANMLPIRARNIDGSISFNTFLNTVANCVQQVLKYQDFPFPSIVENSQVQRHPGRSPIVETSLTFIRHSPHNPLGKTGQQLMVEGQKLTILAVGEEEGQFDLNIKFVELEDSVMCSLKYSSNLFTPDTANRIANRFQQLLTACISMPSTPLNMLPMLGKEETHLLLHEWNNTTVDYTSHPRLVHHLFEAQVKLTPNSIAVKFEDKQLSYEELDNIANRIANQLQLQSATLKLVGVVMCRSEKLVAALLGVLKAQAAYVPIDPSMPVERMSAMLQPCDMVIVDDTTDALVNLTAKLNLNQMPPSAGLLPLPQTYSAEQLAYVIFTSGSTGVPKGVQVNHRNVVNFLLAMKETLHVLPTNTLLAVTVVSFDIAAMELFLPLISGACVVVASDKDRLDASALDELLQSHNATIMQATPATWALFHSLSWPGNKDLKVMWGQR